LQDFKRFDFEQTHLVDYILNDVYSTWLETEILLGRIKASCFEKDPFKWVKPKWIMPKRDLVDPLKEITAIEKKIKNNLTCETDVANSMGEDYEQILIKKAKERDLKIKYKLPLGDEYAEDDNDSGKTEVDEHQTGGESANNKKGKK